MGAVTVLRPEDGKEWQAGPGRASWLAVGTSGMGPWLPGPAENPCIVWARTKGGPHEERDDGNGWACGRGRAWGQRMTGYGLHFEVGFAGERGGGGGQELGGCHQSGNGGGQAQMVAEEAEGNESQVLETGWLWGQGGHPGFRALG